MRRRRFTLRSLAIVVTLVCAYFGSWPLTRKYGVPQYIPIIPRWQTKKEYLANADSPAPLIVRQDFIGFEKPATIRGLEATAFKRRYYIWLGVTKIGLPYETSWSDREAFDLRIGFPHTTAEMRQVNSKGIILKTYLLVMP